MFLMQLPDVVFHDLTIYVRIGGEWNEKGNAVL